MEWFGPKTFESFQNVRRPAEDVATSDDPAHGAHACPPLVERHVDRLEQRVGKAVHVVRVDDYGLTQLLRRAGQPAEHEHAIIIIARGYKFLGNKVHTVV